MRIKKRGNKQKLPARRPGNDPANDGDIRIGPILPVPELLREFGVEPAGLLATVGLDEMQFEDAENRISFDALGHLFQACIAATNCAHFGLLLGRHFSPATLGLNFYLMRNARTLREALRGFELHAHLHDRGSVPYLIEQNSKEVGFCYGIYHAGRFDAAPIYDGALAISMAVFRSICGPEWHPVRVSFTRSRPADLSPYQRYFGVPLHFNADHAALYFAARWLDEPIKGRDPVLQAVLLRLLKERDAERDLTFSESVRRALRTIVVAGADSTAQMARLFAQNRRSLHRRLQAEGTNLRTLVNEARCEVSRRLLKESNMPIGEIAALLKYSDGTAFSRAFRGWTGVSPREWRSAQNNQRIATRRLG
jgi:AraC-like DNA-binding protein